MFKKEEFMEKTVNSTHPVDYLGTKRHLFENDDQDEEEIDNSVRQNQYITLVSIKYSAERLLR
jgi:hypothetical protein